MSEAFKLAEYGVAIFTVGLCITLVWLLFNNFLKHTEKQNQAFSDSVKDIADRHERERHDWLSSEERRSEQTTEVLSDLRDIIKESIRKKPNGES
jgi:hypothetical protein